MSIPVPLGVRIYNDGESVFDTYVTNNVEDIVFRSVIPGGFASATIRLHNDALVLYGLGDAGAYNNLADLFNRVQICDTRTMEVVWEGRIEDSHKIPDGDGWELGCLGAMIVATDIQRAMFYIDSGISSWIPNPGGYESTYDTKTDDNSETITVTLKDSTWSTITSVMCYAWQKAEEIAVNVGRFDVTYKGGGSNAALAKFSIWGQVTDALGTNPVTVDSTVCNAAQIRRANVIVTDFASQVVKRLYFHIGLNSAPPATVAGQNVMGRFIDPHVQAQRFNRFGTALVAAADYPLDFVRVHEVVEDVIGRFLVGGWVTNNSKLPYPGQINPNNVIINTNSIASITKLTYWDGATAADILNDLTEFVEPNYYWAIWESNRGATNQPGGFRFEWTDWPKSWGYQASSVDGLDSQPTGKDIYNGMFYEYPTSDADGSGLENLRYTQHAWDDQLNSASYSRALANGNVTRFMYVKKEERITNSSAGPAAQALLASNRKTVNAGTLTVARPIYLFDQGANGLDGCTRALDPWNIRPGKLIRITDTPARSNSHDMTKGNSTWPEELDGTIYRVVATEFSSSTGECKLELDQTSAWDLATQINKKKGASNIKVKG